MKIIKINFLTIYFLLILFLCGYLKVGLIIFLIVIFHELGHVFFIKLFKYKILDITIYPFGGMTKVSKDINTPVNKEILIAMGGIIFQLLLFIIIYFLPLNIITKATFYKYNLSIMIFNILPIIPLDGSIILNAFLNKFFSFKVSYHLYFLVSILCIFFYLLSNIWFSLNNYLIITLFVVKTYYTYKNYNYIFNKFLLERYLNKYEFKYLSTREGNLDILKLDTYQYFKEKEKVVGEAKKLQERFDK